jgi:hypothetical protein
MKRVAVAVVTMPLGVRGGSESAVAPIAVR